nr:unnamed protein product [Callosobruchus analis]
MRNKSKSIVDNKGASEQLIISEQVGGDMMKEKPPLDKKKLAALEKERKKAEKKLQEKLKKAYKGSPGLVSEKWNDLRDYYQSFPWNDVCFKSRDLSECAQEITEVLISGMEAYVSHVVNHPSKNKP